MSEESYPDTSEESKMEPTESISERIKVLGKRVLVKKERIDSGGIRLSPIAEAEGEKNYGKVLALGDIGAKLQMKGLEVGSVILFKKHFIPNHVEGAVPLVFVECEDILAII